MSSPVEKKPRRWFWFLALTAAVLLIFGGVLGFALANLTQIARWAVQRLVPHLIVELGEVRLEAWDRVAFEKLAVRERASRTEILSMNRGSVVFSVDGLLRRRIGEVRLDFPRLQAGPGLSALAGSGGGGGSNPWAIERVVCSYGELVYDGLGEGRPLVRCEFAFDWKLLGDPSAADQALEIVVWDVRAYGPETAAPFLLVDLVRAQASQGALRASKVDRITVQGGELVVGRALERLAGTPGKPAGSGAAGWVVGDLKTNELLIRIDDAREGIADITFFLNTELRDLPLAGTASAVGELPQVVEILDLEVLSPLDPLTKVLTLRRLALRFRLAGILKRELDAIEIEGPVIHVGPDLFWYMEDTQKRLAAESGGEAAPGWKIDVVEIRDGQLKLGSAGRAEYGLPLNFGSTLREVDLDNLASLQIEAALEIPAQDYDFGSYQLVLSTERGDLRFSYPPDSGKKNLVGKVFLRRILWRQFETTEAWVSATFDKAGINGDFGGAAYGGYLSGGFSFLFDPRSPWIGWAAGTGLSFRKFTDVLSPQNFRMTGPMDFNLQVDAFGAQIERFKAAFQARKPGRMVIGKIDDFLANIPDAWPALKQDSTRIALEALRDFDYETATGNMWFVGKQGIAELRLQGPLGSRNFDIVLHADESLEGRWKKGR